MNETNNSAPTAGASDAGQFASVVMKEGAVANQIISKRQMKRQKKMKSRLEFRKIKRAKEKERRKARRKAIRESGDLKLLKPKIYDMSTSKCPIHVAVDMSYQQLMNENLLRKTINQLNFAYGLNRRAENPLQYHIANLNGLTKSIFDSYPGYSEWDVFVHEESIGEIWPADDVVYLTSNSPNVLEDLDSSKVYVIGGLLDHNAHPGVSLAKAIQNKFNHARLPIGEYVKLQTRKVLTINQVFEIILRFWETKDWKAAFFAAIPKRKGLQTLDQESANGTVDLSSQKTIEISDESQGNKEVNDNKDTVMEQLVERISVDESDLLRWKDVQRLTHRPSKFAPDYFVPGKENFTFVQESHILVLGAGGLGCEILKGLALSGFHNIDVIDMDIIDVTNLNRQFLFRSSDVGRSKAEVAAEFVRNRVADCVVTPHNCKIQDKDMDFYRQFSLVICGLDSIEARRWINARLCDMVMFDENGDPLQSTVIPLIDGGTEGFKGSARIIYPHFTACIECTLYMFPPQINYPMCTIANTPRLPEHCIEYVKVVIWEKENPFEDSQLDTDNSDHIKWVFIKANERAKKFGIDGVTMQLTVGVLKRVIPAVASTNAIVANSCVLETFKLISNTAAPLKNYLNFQDVDGATCNVVEVEKSANCLVCGSQSQVMEFSKNDLLEKLLKNLNKDLQFRNPSIQAAGTLLYKISELLPEMKRISEQNLKRTFEELNLAEGSELLINDDSMTKPISIRLRLNC